MAATLHADRREIGHWRWGSPTAEPGAGEDWVDGEAFTAPRSELGKPPKAPKTAADAAHCERWKAAKAARRRRDEELHQRRAKHRHQLQ